MPKESRWNKRNHILAAAISLTAAFTALFFPAAESFFLNPIDFSLPVRSAVLPLLLIVLAVVAGLWLVQMFCLLIHEKLFRIVNSLLFGISLACYIQVLCYNGRLDQLDSAEHKFPSMTYLTLNWVLMLIVAVIPLIAYLLTLVKPVIRFTKHFKWELIPILGGVIVFMQLAGLGSAYLRYSQSGLSKKTSSQYFISYEPTTSLSKEHNIVIFLLDRMDGTFVDDLCRQYPDFTDRLEGFTAYRNNTSCFTLTFPSVPEMLSGIRYNGESWLDYTSLIWAGDDNAVQQIHSAGYHCNLILDSAATFQHTSQIAGCADNLKCAEENLDFRYDYFGYNGILPTELRLSMYRSMPYILKPLFEDISMANFIVTDESAEDYHTSFLGPLTDVNYNNYMKKHPLDAENGKPTFSFIHLNGAHDTSVKVKALWDDSVAPVVGLVNSFHEIMELRGDFTIIERYLEQMKELGIYDCSEIIILGDHGQQHLQYGAIDENGNPLQEITSGLTTALMIKPANAPHEPMQFDRETEMSNAYFPASILEYAGLDHSKYGISFSEAAAGAPHEDRIINIVKFKGYSKTPELLFKFSVSGDANDYANWKLIS